MKKLAAVCADNAANVIKAVKECLNDCAHLTCAAHTLRLCVENVLADVKQDDRALKESCRPLLVELQINRAVQKQQPALGLKQHKLLQDVPTRWNSVY